ncbi:MAG: thioesterase family protein [Pseudomonadota bacterium]
MAFEMTYSLDQATELEKIDGNRFRRDVDETWWNFDNAFGGWAAATAFSAIQAREDCRGELLSLNAVFPRPIKSGQIEVQTELLARRTQSDFWRVTIVSGAQPDDTLVAFDIVMGRKRALDEDSFEKIPPDAPEPDSLEQMNMEGMGPVWLQHYDQRPFIGTPFTRNVRPRNCAWVSHKDGRPIDTKGLIALCDTPMPRVFFTATTPRFGSTISFSVSSTCGEDVLNALQTKRVLIEADSRNVGRGSYDQLVNIWSECGSLLSVSNQTAVFR